MTVVVRVLRASTDEIWSTIPRPASAFDAQSAIALLTTAPSDVAIYVIPWGARQTGEPLYASSRLLAQRSTYFRFSGDFKKETPDLRNRPDDEFDWPDSDDEGETDNAAPSASAVQMPHTLVVREFSRATVFAFLIYLATGALRRRGIADLAGSISFAPLTSAGVDARKPAIARVEAEHPLRPRPVSCKSAFRLAERCDAASLRD